MALFGGGRNSIELFLLSALALYTFFTTFLLLRLYGSEQGCPAHPIRDETFPGRHEPRPDATYFLVIGVLTGPTEIAARQVARETWIAQIARGNRQRVRVVFPIGTANVSSAVLADLDAESQRESDLVFLPTLRDEYGMLGHKTLRMMSRLVELFHFDYVMKTDADSFVRVDALLRSLRDVSHRRLYWGFLDGRARPQRKGKWADSSWNVCDRYLPYHVLATLRSNQMQQLKLGGGYVLSRELAEWLAKSEKELRVFRNEDVSMGAWLAPVRVHYVHDWRFDTEFRSRGCHPDYLVTHPHSADRLRQLASNLRQPNNPSLCGAQGAFRVRASYIYDFSVPPSQCCTRSNDSHFY